MLQRSSYSFRRQGSSGRTWTNHISSVEYKGNVMPVTAASAGKDVRREENVSKITRNKQEMVQNDQVSHSQSLIRSSTSKSENKVQRGFLSSIFGPCMKPSTV
ncbi:hypothetical protein L6164_008433 [Bauhinia variegata]|uniref:Uncharacterized protein n=1 Tax=Bauhinia variegata TaxID=167791 RepID=A0ACB9PFL1_BAUVA|nr:hypothetical protein L6164_008433 [Bauhinia variegata]